MANSVEWFDDDAKLKDLMEWRGGEGAVNEHLGRVARLCEERDRDLRMRGTPQSREEARRHRCEWTLRVQVAQSRLGDLAEPKPLKVGKYASYAPKTLVDLVDDFGGQGLSGAGLEALAATWAEVEPWLREHFLAPIWTRHLEATRKLADLETRAAYMGPGTPSAAAADALRRSLVASRDRERATADGRLAGYRGRVEGGDPGVFLELMDVARADPGALPLTGRDLRRRLADALVASDPTRFVRLPEDWPPEPAVKTRQDIPNQLGPGGTMATHFPRDSPQKY